MTEKNVILLREQVVDYMLELDGGEDMIYLPPGWYLKRTHFALGPFVLLSNLFRYVSQVSYSGVFETGFTEKYIWYCGNRRNSGSDALADMDETVADDAICSTT